MNFFYFFYFVLRTDYTYVYNQIRDNKNRNTIITLLDIIYCTLRYGSSFEDYFIYKFHEKTKKERQSFVTTVFAHRFFHEMNDKDSIMPFRDKAVFDRLFKLHIKRDTIIADKVSEEEFLNWCIKKNEVIVKPLDGVQGKGIYKTKVETNNDSRKLFYKIKGKKYVVEEVIQQHSDLNKLNPSSVNSVRIITVSIKNETTVIAAVLRIGVGSIVDNFSEGGIAAPIDLETGSLFKEAINREQESFDFHPITGIKIEGFKIPHWNEVKDLVITASKIVPSVKTVGWDVALTQEGPDIIEGNDNWNKNIFQLPFKKGKKKELKKILEENKVR